MNIHEYQAKALLKDYGVPVSDGRVVLKADEAKRAASELDGPLWVVKSQIHAGGRGKGKFKEAAAGEKGGVRLARSVDEVKQFAKEMLGNTLVTVQTGEAGKQVNRLYIEDGADIARELYCSLLVDRSVGQTAFVVSTALRVAQGSATVALTTTAGLMAPTVAATSGLSALDLCLIVIAIACGATVLIHVNDSGFWLVGRFLGMDEKTTLKTWTVMETLIGGIGFVLAFALSLVL